MTFSVLALDRASGAMGCAAATGNLAVGGWVPRADARGGVVATQGYSVSHLWGDEALARLIAGEAAQDIVTDLTKADAGRDWRQLGVLDRAGRAAVWTGADNMDAKGHRLIEGGLVLGNWLSGEAVLDAMAEAYAVPQERSFGHRLLAVLDAGAAAGSDARGTVSAALRIVAEDRAPLDLRVDEHEDPIARLIALYDKATHAPYSDWARGVPTLADPERC